MSDSSASERMYSKAFTLPKKIELRVNSRKTLRVDISGVERWGHDSILERIPDVSPADAALTYARHETTMRSANRAFRDQLDIDYPIVPGEPPTVRGAKLTARQNATDKAVAEGLYVEEVQAEALTRTLQEYGYDALDLIDEPHRQSVGGSQVIVFDPKRVTVVQDDAP